MEALTYAGPQSDSEMRNDPLVTGAIVTVPVGRRVVPGVVVKKVVQPNFKCKPIMKVLYSEPLPRHLISVVKFLHEYYLAASGQAVGLILPKGVEKQRRRPKTERMFGAGSRPGVLATGPDETFRSGSRPSDPSPQFRQNQKTEHGGFLPEIPLNEAQKNALKALQKAPGATKLLYGVTGSGKTNIYLKMTLNALQGHKSTILLVPEIALTGQLVRVFEEVFGERVVVIHSRQTEVERHLIFERILNAEEPLIVVGPRSALFAPVQNLGLIVIDEEHESSYYQENAPKYSAIRVASFIAKEVRCPLILGSATPAVEDFYLASRLKTAVTLTEKAKSTAVKPKIKIIDFKDRTEFSKNRYFSNSLLRAIASNLEQERQTLIFHNRRGSAPLTICDNCGEEILCPNCFLPLTLHADSYELKCHTCGFGMKVPAMCPKCGAPELVHKGFGTKLLESELMRLFPAARVRRFDADNKKGEGMDAMYTAVREGEVDILVGTQTLAKGLDLPKLATVGVVQADAGLSLPDYMAEERTFQLLTQVIGRVGRGHLDVAEVYIQTYRPEHPVIALATHEDYPGFCRYIVNRRQRSGFPPYRFVMKLEITMKTERIVVGKVREAMQLLGSDKRLDVSPPQPAFHERTDKGYTWQIIVRSQSRRALVETCAKLNKNFKITLDPPGLL